MIARRFAAVNFYSIRFDEQAHLAPGTKIAPAGAIIFSFAERAGFEPAVPCGTQTFQACTIGHSDTSPIIYNFLKNQIFSIFQGDKGI